VHWDEQASSGGRRSTGQDVVVPLDAPGQQVQVFASQRRLLAVKPLRAVVGAALSLEAFVRCCEQEARARWRRYLSTDHPLRQASEQG